jgi:hypothetical protein
MPNKPIKVPIKTVSPPSKNKKTSEEEIAARSLLEMMRKKQPELR